MSNAKKRESRDLAFIFYRWAQYPIMVSERPLKVARQFTGGIVATTWRQSR